MGLYEDIVKSNPGRDAVLESQLAAEDQYQSRVAEILARARAPAATLSDYTAWTGFQGGADNARTLVRVAGERVQEAALGFGAEVPSAECGFWPGFGINARSLRTPQGNVVVVNIGVLIAVRRFMQAVVESTEDLFGVAFGGPDKRSRGEIREEFLTDIRAFYDGSEIRGMGRVSVLRGPREVFRREAIWAAICYVVAHEAGHLAQKRRWKQGWRPDNAEFQGDAIAQDVTALTEPRNEVDVVRAFSRETIADDSAFGLMRRRPFAEQGRPSLSVVVGALSVLALQSSHWWHRAAYTTEDLGWSHPFPEGRMWMAADGLGAPLAKYGELGAEDPRQEIIDAPPDELQNSIRTFLEWSNDVLAIKECRQLVQPHGLGNRGLNPMSLVFIYATDPEMLRQKSELLMDLSAEPGAESEEGHRYKR